MYTADFRGANAKLERAQEHISSLDELMRGEVEKASNAPVLSMRFESKTSEYVLYVSSMPDIEPLLQRVSLLIGDAVHNLRGAGDHVVYQLALRHKRGALEHERVLQLPIDEEPEVFDKRCKQVDGYIGQLGFEDQNILRAYQPFDEQHVDRTLNLNFHPLALIRDLSNRDKHRLLVDVWLPTSGFHFPGSGLNAAKLMFIEGSFRRIMSFNEPLVVNAEVGAVVARNQHERIPNVPDEVANCGYVTAHVVLKDLDLPIVDVLKRCAAGMEDLVGEFNN